MGHYFLAILCVLIPEVGENRFILAGLLAFLVAPLAVVCSIKFDLQSNGWSESYFDLLTLLILVHLIPDQWTLALVLGVVIALSPAFSVHSNSHIYYLGAAIMLIAGMTIAALVHKVPDWYLYIALLVAVYPGVIYYANWQMKRANALRAEAQKVESMKLLAGGVAHDFNNLLTAVMGNTELAQLYMEPDHPSYAPLSEVMLATKRAGLLSKQLLSFSGRQAHAYGQYNLGDELTTIADLVKSTVASDITITLDISPSLPAGHGDPTQIQQVLLNLLLNATEASTAPAVVKATAKQQTIDSVTSLVLTIADEGSGIDKELHQKIFDPFYSSKSRGHGLGLATVERIVSEHQGKVQVESQKGVGTTITVTLPIDGNNQEQGQQANTKSNTKNELLIVDDEVSVRNILTRFLEPEGYITHEADNGEQALELFKEKGNKIAVILLDLKMPKMDGWQCLKEIRALNPDIPVVIISGYNPDDEMGATNDTRLHYITKPFLRSEVLKTVAASL